MFLFVFIKMTGKKKRQETIVKIGYFSVSDSPRDDTSTISFAAFTLL